MNNKLRELKVTIPADKKSRESVAAGYVTDNNSGGYFVIECQECGAVYPSQHADGGGQIADTGDYNDAICPHCGEEGPEECENVGLAWNVQQAKIIALLAELEAKDKRIAELSHWLEHNIERAKAAEQKLATPVQLKKVDSSNVPFAGDGFNAGVDYCAKDTRAAGFTVEGDEQ
ncbi:hypothetical protein [Serratia quinivorans]|uniref:hypothetical protein n=1 Tax=Serratia quinivorans TaxID=137545 RepID=UPI003F985A8F